MRRPVVVLVLLAILGLFACCAGAPKEEKRKRNRLPQRPPDIKLNPLKEDFREVVQQYTGKESTNFDQSHHPYPDMSNIPQSTNFTHHPYPNMSNIPQSTNFNQSPHPYPVMSNIPQSTNFNQSHPNMSNIPQSTNFTQHGSHYDQGMSSTIQSKTTIPKRIRLSKKPSTTYIPTDTTNFKQRVQEKTAKPPEGTTTTAGGGSTQWTNPAGLNQSQYDLAPLPGYEQFPAMSQNFQSQQPSSSGWFSSVSNFLNPKNPKH